MYSPDNFWKVRMSAHSLPDVVKLPILAHVIGMNASSCRASRLGISPTNNHMFTTHDVLDIIHTYYMTREELEREIAKAYPCQERVFLPPGQVTTIFNMSEQTLSNSILPHIRLQERGGRRFAKFGIISVLKQLTVNSHQSTETLMWELLSGEQTLVSRSALLNELGVPKLTAVRLRANGIKAMRIPSKHAERPQRRYLRIK